MFCHSCVCLYNSIVHNVHVHLYVCTDVQVCKYIVMVVELQDKADVMSQLRALEREDRTHRQKSLAKMPVS